jgi:uncharacterized membrane protein
LSRRDRRWLAVLALVSFLIDSGYAWVRHSHYLTTGFDLGIFDQAVRAYSRFEAPIVPLKAPGYHLLGDHFHPVIALWAPLYWIWDDPRMLLLAQAALIAVSVVPVASFTARRFGSRPAVVVAAMYVFSWPLQRMVQFDVHEVAFAVPALAWVIDAVDRRARRTTVVASLVLLATREDMGAVVALIGVLVALYQVGRTAEGGRRWWPARTDLLWGLGLLVGGAAGYELATAVVIPHFSEGRGFAYWTFAALGPDPASAVRFMLTHPIALLQLMVTPWEKAHTLLMLGLPVLYLCLGSRYLLLAAPLIAQRMLNDRAQLWSTNFHYSSVLAPILFLAAVDAAGRIAARLDGRRLRLPRIGPVRMSRSVLVNGWLAGCAAVPIVAMLALAGDYPLSRLATARFWRADLRVQAMNELLPLIPDGVCVEADNTAAPHLTRRDYVTRVGRSDGLATWMVLDFSRADTGWQGDPPMVAYVDALRRGFVAVAQHNVIVVLNRPDAPVAAACRVR